jgi:hypothetical protein
LKAVLYGVVYFIYFKLGFALFFSINWTFQILAKIF